MKFINMRVRAPENIQEIFPPESILRQRSEWMFQCHCNREYYFTTDEVNRKKIEERSAISKLMQDKLMEI